MTAHLEALEELLTEEELFLVWEEMMAQAGEIVEEECTKYVAHAERNGKR